MSKSNVLDGDAIRRSRGRGTHSTPSRPVGTSGGRAPSSPSSPSPSSRGFVVVRVAKVPPSARAVAAVQKHNERINEKHVNPDIDPKRTPENSVLIAPPDGSWSKAVTRRVEEVQSSQKRKLRSDACRALEVVVTASPEALAAMSPQEQDRFFKDSLAALVQRHGRENIVSAVIHRDETTPHLHALVVPVSEARVKAEAFTNPKALRELQDTFGTIGKPYGLSRGREKSKAQHEHFAAFKARTMMAKTPVKAPETLSEALPRPKLIETARGYQKRAVAQFRADYEALAAKASGYDAAEAEKAAAKKALEVAAKREKEALAREQKALAKAREALQKVDDVTLTLSACIKVLLDRGIAKTQQDVERLIGKAYEEMQAAKGKEKAASGPTR